MQSSSMMKGGKAIDWMLTEGTLQETALNERGSEGVLGCAPFRPSALAVASPITDAEVMGSSGSSSTGVENKMPSLTRPTRVSECEVFTAVAVTNAWHEIATMKGFRRKTILRKREMFPGGLVSPLMSFRSA